MTDILTEITSETPKKTLWHYTNQRGLLGIVRSQAIWATHHQYLNDRTEFTHARDLIRDEVKLRYARLGLSGANPSVENYYKTLLFNLELPFHGVFIFVCSFSEAADDLSQWRAYSRNSPGIAIGFSPDGLSKLASKRHWTLSRCVYNKEHQTKIADAIANKLLEGHRPEPAADETEGRERAIRILDNTSKHLQKYGLLMKHNAFESEQEWRLISPAMMYSDKGNKFREAKSTLVPYREFSFIYDEGKLGFEAIMIGPTPNQDESDRAVRSLLETHQVHNHEGKSVDVVHSEIPFRDW